MVLLLYNDLEVPPVILPSIFKECSKFDQLQLVNMLSGTITLFFYLYTFDLFFHGVSRAANDRLKENMREFIQSDR